MLDEQDLLTTAVEKKPPLEIISTFSKGITLTPPHSSGLWILMANCLAEGSSLKSLWLDGFEKLFLLRNVTDLYMAHTFIDICVYPLKQLFSFLLFYAG